jgi:hypothetical protein
MIQNTYGISVFSAFDLMSSQKHLLETSAPPVRIVVSNVNLMILSQPSSQETPEKIQTSGSYCRMIGIPIGLVNRCFNYFK